MATFFPPGTPASILAASQALGIPLTTGIVPISAGLGLGIMMYSQYARLATIIGLIDCK